MRHGQLLSAGVYSNAYRSVERGEISLRRADQEIRCDGHANGSEGYNERRSYQGCPEVELRRSMYAFGLIIPKSNLAMYPQALWPV
jgi:hypothetical protein